MPSRTRYAFDFLYESEEFDINEHSQIIRQFPHLFNDERDKKVRVLLAFAGRVQSNRTPKRLERGRPVEDQAEDQGGTVEDQAEDQGGTVEDRAEDQGGTVEDQAGPTRSRADIEHEIVQWRAMGIISVYDPFSQFLINPRPSVLHLWLIPFKNTGRHYIEHIKAMSKLQERDIMAILREMCNICAEQNPRVSPVHRTGPIPTDEQFRAMTARILAYKG